jgi:hypothetical protein
MFCVFLPFIIIVYHKFSALGRSCQNTGRGFTGNKPPPSRSTIVVSGSLNSKYIDGKIHSTNHTPRPPLSAKNKHKEINVKLHFHCNYLFDKFIIHFLKY